MILLNPISIAKQTLKESLSVFENLVVGPKGGYGQLVLVLVSVIVTWHVYTPLHELMHVAGCVLTGGQVRELALSPQYGATLLKPIFPFIKVGSDYAGQLTDFTYPNRLAYAVIDFFPYLLSLPGVLLLRWAAKSHGAFLFGVSVVLMYVPLMSIPGDFFEAASLVGDYLVAGQGGLAAGEFVSDDFFLLAGRLADASQLFGWPGLVLLLCLGSAALLAFFCLSLQLWIADRWMPVKVAEPSPEPLPEGQRRKTNRSD